MESKEIEFDSELFKDLKKIADREGFQECLEILSTYNNQKLTLSQDQAQYLTDVLGFEATRLSLKSPYSDEHPNYTEEGADEWADFCQSVVPHAMNCIKRYFDVEEE
ncbi:hypothetical protein [Litoribacillus peritrichatus]|uniref:Uncharacterized protein n=1 Tax=Litoribacillus peritrichatus TaxID=718191 RepID=A0ABP7MAS8_9GAMM